MTFVPSTWVIAATGNAEAGQAKAATCVACHGVDGNSAVPTFPKLAGLGHKYLLKQMLDIRDGRRPVALMAGQVDNMSDDDLADIAAFYNAQTRTGGSADPDMVEVGRKIYLAGIADRQVPACSGCHSPTGNGNGPAGYPALGGQHAEYIASQLKMFRKGYEDHHRAKGEPTQMSAGSTVFRKRSSSPRSHPRIEHRTGCSRDPNSLGHQSMQIGSRR
jgi:cytochrome c553